MKTMQKEMVFRSIFRHTLALCLAVPFVGLADSYSWTGSNGNVNDLQIELSQVIDITSLGQTINIAKFDDNSFVSSFRSQLSSIDSNLPYNDEWSLSSVIIEVSGDVNGISISYNGGIAGGGNATLTVGDFVIQNGNDSTTVATFTFAVPTTSSITDGNPWTATDLSDPNTIGYSHDVTVSNPNIAASNTSLFEGSGTATGAISIDVDLDGAAYYPVTASGTYPRITYTVDTENPISETAVTVGNSLSGLNLTMNIRYIVTPEPGTMALLLTGIPLLLVRRRKSLKK